MAIYVTGFAKKGLVQRWHRKLLSTGGHCTLSGHNFYGENYIPMEGNQKPGGTSPPCPPGSYAYAYTRNYKYLEIPI